MSPWHPPAPSKEERHAARQAAMQRRKAKWKHWVVWVPTEDDDDDPAIFGPYIERSARSLVDKFNARIDHEDSDGFYRARCFAIRPLDIKGLLAEFEEESAA